MDLLKKYKEVRKHSEDICTPLKTEDYVVQPVVDVSPPKWHIGHTTWFFETFVLKPNMKNYEEFDPQYNYVFNSYYETVGARVITDRPGKFKQASVEDIYKYRKYVDDAMKDFLRQNLQKNLKKLLHLDLIMSSNTRNYYELISNIFLETILYFLLINHQPEKKEKAIRKYPMI